MYINANKHTNIHKQFVTKFNASTESLHVNPYKDYKTIHASEMSMSFLISDNSVSASAQFFSIL